MLPEVVFKNGQENIIITIYLEHNFYLKWSANICNFFIIFNTTQIEMFGKLIFIFNF